MGQPFGYADHPHDRGGGDGVGWGYDAPQQESERKGETGDPCPGYQGDDAGGEDHDENGEDADDASPAPHFLPGDVPCGFIEEGWEKDQEDQFRVDLDMG